MLISVHIYIYKVKFDQLIDKMVYMMNKKIYIVNSFKSIYRSFHIFNCRQLFRTSGPHQYSALNKKNRKAAQYELRSAIFHMEQYIQFSLICKPFSQVLETLTH